MYEKQENANGNMQIDVNKFAKVLNMIYGFFSVSIIFSVGREKQEAHHQVGLGETRAA